MPSRAHRIATFYAVTFVVTHLITTAYRVRGGSWNSLDTFVVANGIMLVPGLVVLPPALMLLTLGVSLLVPGTSYDPTMSGLSERLGFSAADGARLRSQIGFLGLPPLAGFLAQGLILGPTLGLVGGLGEELAWRGLLHHELMPAGFWRCTAITGLLWALWHVPLTLQGYGYANHPLLGTVVAVVYILLFAPLLTFIRLRARSVLAPAILHGTADGTVLLTLALVRGGGELTTGWGSLSCIAVLAVVDVGLFWTARKMGSVSMPRPRDDRKPRDKRRTQSTRPLRRRNQLANHPPRERREDGGRGSCSRPWNGATPAGKTSSLRPQEVAR